MTPEISYIISVYSWVDQLPTCLYSLRAQTHQDFEVLVTDNSTVPAIANRMRKFVASMRDKRFRYLHTAPMIRVSDCYWSAEVGMKRTTGRWLVFPCDDCYYPPEWTQRMLTTACRNNLDLVLCESSITGPLTCGIDRYAAIKLGSLAFPGYKPSFIVRRSMFPGWIGKPAVAACAGADKTTLQYMIRRPGVRWGVCGDLFYVHN